MTIRHAFTLFLLLLASALMPHWLGPAHQEDDRSASGDSRVPDLLTRHPTWKGYSIRGLGCTSRPGDLVEGASYHVVSETSALGPVYGLKWHGQPVAVIFNLDETGQMTNVGAIGTKGVPVELDGKIVFRLGDSQESVLRRLPTGSRCENLSLTSTNSGTTLQVECDKFLRTWYVGVSSGEDRRRTEDVLDSEPVVRSRGRSPAVAGER